MANINVKVSDITIDDIANYIRLTDISKEDTDFLTKCLEIAKSYIKNYTGVEDLDSQPEFVICAYVLCQDMYDNRTLYNDKTQPNKTIETILNMHNGNLI